MALAFLLTLLLLSELELLVADLPEFCEVLLFLAFISFVLSLAVDLKSTAAFNSLFHFKLSTLLFLVETVSLIFSLSNLLVQDLFLIVT